MGEPQTSLRSRQPVLTRVGEAAPGLSRRGVALAAGVALLGTILRLAHLHDALWQDEVASARILREPTLGGALGRVVHTESTPPLWYVLGWLAHHAGLSIEDVRLLSVAFGAGIGAATVAIAARELPLRSAAGAGLLVTVGSQFAWHGHELRAYELSALLVTLLVLALRRELERPGLRSEVPLALVCAAGLLTHYFFALSLAAAVAWLWGERQARPVRRRATVAVAGGAALCLPWLPFFVEQFRRDRYWWIGPFRLQTVVQTPLRLFTPLVDTGLAAQVVPILFVLLVAAGAFALARRSAAGRLCVVLGLAPLSTAAALWAGGLRIYAVRNLIGIGPFVALAAVAGLSLLPCRAATVSLAALGAAAATLFALTQASPAPPYQGVARALVREGWRSDDPVAVFGNFFDLRAPLEWYLPHQPVLAVARPTGAHCGEVFVVAGLHAARRLAGLRAVTRVGGYLVARLGPGDGLRRKGLARATVLADPARLPRCVAVVDDPRLRPIV